jgi:hypothetical protein
MNILNSVNATATSTNTSTLISGSILNATNGMSVSFTVKNTGLTNSVDYLIIAGNASDLSDGVTIQNSATLAAGAVGSYGVQVAVFSYYGIKIVSTSAGNHTTVEAKGRVKG